MNDMDVSFAQNGMSHMISFIRYYEHKSEESLLVLESNYHKYNSNKILHRGT